MQTQNSEEHATLQVIHWLSVIAMLSMFRLDPLLKHHVRTDPVSRNLFQVKNRH